MSVQVKIDTRALEKAMADYAKMKKKSDASVVNKAMRFWLPFAGSRVKDKTSTGADRADQAGQKDQPWREEETHAAHEYGGGGNCRGTSSQAGKNQFPARIKWAEISHFCW